ncbi:MAG: hypothetical protein V1726_03480 [Methanobacteriota archaeon]
MNKKIVGVMLCLLMLVAIPVAAGVQSTTSPDESDGLFTRTVVRGVILGSRTDGRTTTFFALAVHYTTYKLIGEPETGMIILKRVTFNGNFIGHLGKFTISGNFRGAI